MTWRFDPICLEYCRLLSHRFWLMSLLLGVIRWVSKKKQTNKQTKTKSFSLTFKSHLFIQYLRIKCLAKFCNYFLESPIAREKFWNFFLIKLFLLTSVNKQIIFIGGGGGLPFFESLLQTGCLKLAKFLRLVHVSFINLRCCPEDSED